MSTCIISSTPTVVVGTNGSILLVVCLVNKNCYKVVPVFTTSCIVDELSRNSLACWNIKHIRECSEESRSIIFISYNRIKLQVSLLERELDKEIVGIYARDSCVAHVILMTIGCNDIVLDIYSTITIVGCIESNLGAIHICKPCSPIFRSTERSCLAVISCTPTEAVGTGNTIFCSGTVDHYNEEVFPVITTIGIVGKLHHLSLMRSYLHSLSLSTEEWS